MSKNKNNPVGDKALTGFYIIGAFEINGMKPYYEADGIVIYHGDCLGVIKDIPDSAIATVFTDPPYSSGARQSAQMRSRGSMRRAEGPHGKGRWFNTDNLTSHGFAMLVRLLMVEFLRVTQVDGHFFSFIDWRQWPVLAGVTESAGWSIRSCLVWDKMHFGMGNGFRQQVRKTAHACHYQPFYQQEEVCCLRRVHRTLPR